MSLGVAEAPDREIRCGLLDHVLRLRSDLAPLWTGRRMARVPRSSIFGRYAIDGNDAKTVALLLRSSSVFRSGDMSMISSKMTRAALVASTMSLAIVFQARADVAIGVLIPSSGKGASYGQQQQNAIHM